MVADASRDARHLLRFAEQSGWCLGLDEMDGSSKAVVLVCRKARHRARTQTQQTQERKARMSSEVTLLGSPSSLAQEFARRVTTLLQTPVLKAPPRRRSRRLPSSASLCRISRLAAKCHLHAANSTLQTQKVLLLKWDPATPKQQPATQVLNAFRQAFQEPLDSSKRQALQMLFKVDLKNVDPTIDGLLEDAC